MSKRAVISAAVVVIAATIFGLGYYGGGYRQKPEPTVAVPTPEPTPPPAPPATEPIVTTAHLPIEPEHLVEPELHHRPPPLEAIAAIGGEKIPLRLRRPDRQQSVEGLDWNMEGGFFSRLAPAARDGNDGAAQWLYQSLDACKQFPKTRAEYDAAIEKSRKQYAETGGIRVAGEEVRDWEEWRENIESHFHRCEGVTDDMYATATQLLRESVERGCDDNRFYYAQAIESTDPNGAYEQYKILADKGYVSGMQELGKTELAYNIAAIVARSALSDRLPAASRDRLLNKLEAETTPSRFQAASTEAAQVLKSPDCCRLY